MEAFNQEATMNPSISSKSRALLCGAQFMATIAPAYAAAQPPDAVSYTHLTLPTSDLV